MSFAIQIGSALAGGYAIATLCESAVHQHIQHAPRQVAARWRRRGGLWAPLYWAWRAHRAHHARLRTADRASAQPVRKSGELVPIGLPIALALAIALAVDRALLPALLAGPLAAAAARLYVHPRLHASRPPRWLAALARYHAAHHTDTTRNFNLLPGGDWLRGKVALKAQGARHVAESRL
jgi:hypothetical protein